MALFKSLMAANAASLLSEANLKEARGERAGTERFLAAFTGNLALGDPAGVFGNKPSANSSDNSAIADALQHVGEREAHRQNGEEARRRSTATVKSVLAQLEVWLDEAEEEEASNATTYEVVFTGNLVAGLDRGTAAANIQRLTSSPSAKVTALLASRDVVIKLTDSRETAEHFSAAFAQAGAVCSIRSKRRAAAVTATPDKLESLLVCVASLEKIKKHLIEIDLDRDDMKVVAFCEKRARALWNRYEEFGFPSLDRLTTQFGRLTELVGRIGRDYTSAHVSVDDDAGLEEVKASAEDALLEKVGKAEAALQKRAEESALAATLLDIARNNRDLEGQIRSAREGAESAFKHVIDIAKFRKDASKAEEALKSLSAELESEETMLIVAKCLDLGLLERVNVAEEPASEEESTCFAQASKNARLLATYLTETSGSILDENAWELIDKIVAAISNAKLRKELIAERKEALTDIKAFVENEFAEQVDLGKSRRGRKELQAREYQFVSLSEGACVSASRSQELGTPSDAGTAKLIYILYLLGIFVGITVIVGVIIAYVKKPSAPQWLQSHYEFQIRTFWIGVLGSLIGLITAPLMIGNLILLLLLVWLILRCVKGIAWVKKGQAVENVKTWAFS